MKLSTCIYCNRIFERERNTKQFCSLECKNKYNYARRNNQEIPVEVFNRVNMDSEETKPTMSSTEPETNAYKERIQFLEQQIEALSTLPSESNKPIIDIPADEEKDQTEAPTKKVRKDVPFLAKKERIISQLIEEGIETVSIDELKSLGYPLGFFDGWSDEGEELQNYIIKFAGNDEYRIKLLS